MYGLLAAAASGTVLILGEHPWYHAAGVVAATLALVAIIALLIRRSQTPPPDAPPSPEPVAAWDQRPIAPEIEHIDPYPYNAEPMVAPEYPRERSQRGRRRRR